MKILKKRAAKMLRMCATAAVTVLLLISQSGMDAFAAESDETTYKVIIYSGDKGTFSGTDCVFGAGTATLQGDDTIIVSGLYYGDRLNINVSSTNGTVTLNPEDNGKYQPTGTRRSGRDNSEAFDRENATSPSRVYTVTGDRTFVVTYGVPGNMVPYTVSYVLAGTSTPVPGSTPETFYGVAGEKPVVSAPYFDGYTPVYRAITGTLIKGQENAWVFEYSRNRQPGETGTGTQTGTQSSGTGTGTGIGTGTGTGTAQGGGAGAGETAETGEVGGVDGNDTGDMTAIDDEETPDGLLDLDDEEVPTGDLDLGGSEEGKEKSALGAKGTPFFVEICIGAACVTLIVILLCKITRHLKKDLK